MTYVSYMNGGAAVRPWDDGIRWHLEQSADEAPDWSRDPLQLPFVRDQHLRSPNGSVEDEYIEWLIRASYRQAEKRTNRALIPQTFRLVLSAFPWDAIELPKAPLLSVTSIEDGNGEVLLAGSPLEYDLTVPSGAAAGKGTIRPLSGAAWPSTTEGVVVTFEAGYAVEDGYASIPEDITHGRLIMIAELYKQRSESVMGLSSNPALVRSRTLWMDYRVY